MLPRLPAQIVGGARDLLFAWWSVRQRDVGGLLQASPLPGVNVLTHGRGWPRSFCRWGAVASQPGPVADQSEGVRSRMAITSDHLSDNGRDCVVCTVWMNNPVNEFDHARQQASYKSLCILGQCALFKGPVKKNTDTGPQQAYAAILCLHT